MFGWFDPVKKLEKQYARELEEAEKVLARSGDRALHGDLMAKAEETGRKLDEARKKQKAG
jgi:hypothetical protein